MYLETDKKIDLGNNMTIEFLRDDQNESPREWDNLGVFVNCNNQYLIGDDNIHFDDYDRSIKTYLENQDLKLDDVVLLPVFMYDHSGITINTVGFSCGWDSGQVGFIYIEKSKIRNEYGAKRISKKLKARVLGYLQNEIKTLDQFLTGEVYGFNIEQNDCCESCDSENSEHVDSCYGFYGYDIKENGMLDHIDKKHHQAIFESLS